MTADKNFSVSTLVDSWQLGFWSLIATQFQGAFNDNGLKFFVIFLILGTNPTDPQKDFLVFAIGNLFALPFLLPKCPERSEVTKFLADWSERKYLDEYANGSREKHFGLSRATTLLHFLSGGRYPIFDRRVRTAMTRLLNIAVPNEIPWYLDSYCPLFLEVAAMCGTTDLRAVDKALFSYGDRILPFSK
jgi:hypothetical protein